MTFACIISGIRLSWHFLKPRVIIIQKQIQMKTYYNVTAVLFLLMFSSISYLPPLAGAGITENNDRGELSKLNAMFIRNFVTEDVASHERIIHPDFICIESTGAVIGRDEYMKAWAHGYTDSQYKTFDYEDEQIRIFGDVALVRAKTVYTKEENGKIIRGNSVYTDTYLKENGEWKCVQAQITPVR